MSQPQRILSVDDNPRNQMILRKLLSAYDLREARSGEEGLEEAVRFNPDLILLDIMMPGIDGYETCRRLRAMKDRIRSPKIIMVSAKAIVTERLEGYEAGADDYVTKPFNPDELIAKVRVYLRLKSMEELDRMRDSMITLLSHETRTPITCLLSAVELLRQPGCDPRSAQELTEIIQGSADSLHTLIERVVTLSTLRSGSFTFRPEPNSLLTFARNIVEAMQTEAGDRGIALELAGSDDPPCVLDPRFQDLVLRPLLRNAMQHTPADGHVSVEVSHDAASGTARLVVRDDGSGISAEHLPNVMREFVVGDLNHHHRGTGLGLPIARQFIEAHGGRLAIQSTSGEGTEVTVELPTAAGDGEATGEATAQAA